MQEMLNEVGVINMNGRVYDPVLGRFLQADLIIQEPANLQNFNRYSYCFNNPLKYTDPSGYKAIYHAPPVANDRVLETNQPRATLFLDGDKIDGISGGGFLFWTGGGAGAVATTQYFGVPNSYGLNFKGASVSNGALMDAGVFYSTEEVYKSATGKEYSSTYSDVKGTSGAGGAILVNRQYVNQAAVDAAQGGGGTFMDRATSFADLLNEFNPIANMWDVITNAFYGTDRFGRKMSNGEAWLKAASLIPIGKVGSIGSKAAKGLMYDARVEGVQNLYHDFPRLFDSHIIENGAWSQRIIDRANWYEMGGTINGRTGLYQIGINPNTGVIFHRNFVPLPY